MNTNKSLLRLVIKISTFIIATALSSFACQTLNTLPFASTPTLTPPPTAVPTPLPPIPVQPGAENPDEPVFITGEITYTSPFFLNSIYEPFVLLEDAAGFIHRDKNFVFRLEGQAIGPVEIQGEDEPLTYSLALPSIPQGTQVDVDNDGNDDPGVQVFAIAYWSNTWGGPFLERRDGEGWSTAYVSTITDPERDDEVVGGILVVWAPDDEQSFPTSFGEDGLLFTEDDPVAPIPGGYNLVDLDQAPFYIYKEARPRINLNEGDIAVTDYSNLDYAEAFEALVTKAGREYPFTQDKGIDWQALQEKYTPRFNEVAGDLEFYEALHDFAQEIPDGHVGMQINGQAFYNKHGGSFGMILAELSDGRVLVSRVFPDSPADKAGIQKGAEIVAWNEVSVLEALEAIVPYFGPYSTAHHERLEKAIFLTRVPVDTTLKVRFINPDRSDEKEVTMKAIVEYDSLFAALPELSKDPILPPVVGEILDDSGLGYIQVNTFSADYSLMARLWEHFLQGMIDNETPGLVIDLRANSGGSGQLALDFAGYFFDHEMDLSQNRYYSEITHSFELSGPVTHLMPGPFEFKGPVAVLVSPYCISACEGFAYALSQEGRSIIVGHFPTAGAYGEVGRGQYHLPGDISMQFPTGRHESPDGKLLIEGSGVPLDISVPVTEESVLGEADAVLNAAIDALLKK